MTDAPNPLSRLVKHSGIYLIGNAVNRVGAFLLLPIYTRFLSPTEYGALETIYLVSTIVAGLLGAGLAHATLRFYFEYPSTADRNGLVSTNLIASTALSLAGVSVIAIFSTWFTGLLLPGIDAGHAFLWMLAGIVLELGSQVSLAYIRATERSVLFIVISFSKLLVQVLLNSLALIHFKAGVEGVMIGNTITVATGFVVVTAVTLRHCGLHFDMAKLRPVMAYSLPFVGTTIVGLVSATADRFLLQRLVSLEALGFYALAQKFSKLISDLVGEPVNRAYGAFRFTIMQRKDAADIQAKVVTYLAVLLVAIGVGLMLFASDVLRIVADAAYWPAATYVVLLVPASVLSVIIYPLQSGIYFRKNTQEIFYIGVLQCVLSAVLGFVLIRAWGIAGACASVTLVTVVTAIANNYFSQKHFPVHYESGKLMRLTALAAGCVAAGNLSEQLPQVYALLVKGLLFLGFAVLLVLAGVITRGEWQYIAALLKRRKGQAEQSK